MTVGRRNDPVAGFNFAVTLLDSPAAAGSGIATISVGALLGGASAGFSECTGLEMTLDLEEYQEGGRNGTVLQFPTRVQWNPITLKRGIATNRDLVDWFQGFVEGRGRRKNGVITLRDADGRAHTAWTFRRGLPRRWSGPSLNAAQSQVAIESIEITHEGLYTLPGVTS
ncbi:MAG: phage tail protein [Deltaproteobacteria bacterium]|jgi:phage tail-like protein